MVKKFGQLKIGDIVFFKGQTDINESNSQPIYSTVNGEVISIEERKELIHTFNFKVKRINLNVIGNSIYNFTLYPSEMQKSMIPTYFATYYFI